MVRVEGFCAKWPDELAGMINKWLDSHPCFTSLDIQYRISSMEQESDYNHCALVIYEDGREYVYKSN